MYIDLNVGMNRTGIIPGESAIKLYENCSNIKGIDTKGLHAYDGHIRSQDIEQRTIDCDKAFEPVETNAAKTVEKGFPRRLLLPVGRLLFLFMQKEKIWNAARVLLFTGIRVIMTVPRTAFYFCCIGYFANYFFARRKRICLDLGHKSIAAENELQTACLFFKCPGIKIFKP